MKFSIFISRNIKTFPEIGAAISFIIICIIFASLSKKFLTFATWGEILATASELGMISVPVALLMISGNIDLSVGSVYAVSGLLLIYLLNLGLHPIFALVIPVSVCAAIGFINGIMVTKTGIHSFIITLGMMMIVRGLLLVWTGGFPFEIKGYTAGHPILFKLLAARIGATPIRTSAIWFLLCTAIFTFVLSFTKHGNWTFATGGDIKSARDEGVLVNRVQLINFISVGCFTGISGILLVGRMFCCFPTLGFGLELEAIASAVIGGCALMGGSGSVFGAAIGTLIMSTMRIGLVLGGAPAYWYEAFIGLLVIAAVIVRERTLRF